ncbi:hypothetical protein [Bifidobacterium leontopitheci]|uniref:hypothetical protein n=1 Tax=Bifidobacterium leontopitheci TaxID=2650774 RepID=UPI001264C647|nr:hypothetical protein [Bifidobacterium leontopitheci]
MKIPNGTVLKPPSTSTVGRLGDIAIDEAGTHRNRRPDTNNQPPPATATNQPTLLGCGRIVRDTPDEVIRRKNLLIVCATIDIGAIPPIWYTDKPLDLSTSLDVTGYVARDKQWLRCHQRATVLE